MHIVQLDCIAGLSVKYSMIFLFLLSGIPYLELQVSGRQDGEELLCTLNHVPKTRKLESDFRACIHKPSASRRDGLGPGPLLFIMI